MRIRKIVGLQCSINNGAVESINALQMALSSSGDAGPCSSLTIATVVFNIV
ncbi:MAG: hypothetical protein IPH46_17245 [Bacteroidetes bacterium]|nr:hypothetical protein [Bacteroidota bacterium]